jgi:hypothetical protein
VTIVDTCACGGVRVIDLTSGAFVRLVTGKAHPTARERRTALGYGVLEEATIEAAGAAPTLPPTDQEENP